MLITTQAIVIKTIKYGDTSLIGYVFTEAMGLQTLMLKGMRKAKSKSGGAGMWQSGNILDIVLYHHPQKNFQLVKEFKPAVIFQSLPENIVKQCVSVFAMEVLSLYLHKDIEQEDLFYFTKEFLTALDCLPTHSIANLPLYFLIHCGRLNGYIITGKYSDFANTANLREGKFSDTLNVQPPYLVGIEAQCLSDLLQIQNIKEVITYLLNKQQRKQILLALIQFMEWHIPAFKPLKSLSVVSAVLE